MLDLKWIRECPEELDAGLRRRGLAPLSARILDLDTRHRRVLTEMQELQSRRNEASRAIGEAKRRGEDAREQMAEVARLKDRLAALEKEERALAGELEGMLAGLPNMPAPDVPDGPDETANVVVRSHGTPAAFDFPARQHYELGEALGMLDFETAAKLSGARFVVMRDAIARLHRALGQFMIDLHTREHGYGEVAPPYLVRDHVLFGTGQLPKFGADLFRTSDDFWLIPTAEVPLTNLVAGDILDESTFPLRVTALTPCFRSEAGAAGKDTRGMLRQHQFDKVELVSIVHPDHSDDELERMTACAEEVLKRLGLAYRVVVLSTGDMGFAARKTYDIEVWLPGQGTYREISSCSNCGDFQARRMKARFRPSTGKGTRFVHTLNGSGVAVGRCLIAIMETYQRADGTIEVPEVLHAYTGGMTEIRRDG
ncbi:MAG: serine--tRNA ligase [Alphaproteobacteria bacterium]|nr:MAG: serine--tRNA ligase [Alphaproteobacteria bacterium]